MRTALRPIVFIVPGRIDTRTGGYEFDRRIVSGLRDRGWPVVVREVDDSFPYPTPAALAEVAAVLAAVPDSSHSGPLVLVDGLALGAMPAEVEREASRLRIVALVHLPLAVDIGLERDTAARLEASERRALAAAALVVVTGRGTSATLTTYGVDPARIVVIEPGTAPAAVARGSGSGSGGALQLLCVATINPGKGHEILIRALSGIPHRDWHLTCAGGLTRSPRTVDHVRRLMRENGLEGHVSLAGELDAAELEACYDRADVFVLPTLSETFGMAVAEAVAHGLPVVSTTTGAIPDIVGLDEKDAAGLLVPPGDARAFASALHRLLVAPASERLMAPGSRLRTSGNTALLRQFADNARRRRDRLPTWDDAVDKMASALAGLDSDAAA